MTKRGKSTCPTCARDGRAACDWWKIERDWTAVRQTDAFACATYVTMHRCHLAGAERFDSTVAITAVLAGSDSGPCDASTVAAMTAMSTKEAAAALARLVRFGVLVFAEGQYRFAAEIERDASAVAAANTAARSAQ